MTELMHARHMAMLTFLKPMLDEADLPSEILEKSDLLPLHVLVAQTGLDLHERERTLNFSFVPVEDEAIAAVQMLQLYRVLPVAIRPGRKEAVASLLLDVNARLPLGHYGVNEQEELYYRYIYCLSGSQLIEKEELMEVVELILQIGELFEEPIERTARG